MITSWRFPHRIHIRLALEQATTMYRGGFRSSSICKRSAPLVSLVVCLFFLIVPFDAHAQFQNQTLELSASDVIHNCDLYNGAPGVRTVYVRLLFNLGTTGVRFRVIPGNDVTVSFLSETHPVGATSGSTQEGISVCFGACLSG